MIKISIEMPAVNVCSVGECAYNTDTACHARAITVGSLVHPECDTYFSLTHPSQVHSKATQRQAGVGACKMFNCEHNEDYECIAEQINIGHDADMISCLTYRHR